jgi:hypothetical protein
MPRIQGRDGWERKLARAVGSANRDILNRLLDLLGDPPNIDNIPPGFWDEMDGNLQAAVRPVLEDLYRSQAEVMLGAYAVGVDWGLVNAAAIDWAQRYSFRWVKDVNATSRRALQTKVSEFFAEQQMLADLRKSLEPTFGPVRSVMIARTEVTRAAAQGENGLVTLLEKDGLNMIAVYQTANDDRVTPICRGLHGVRAEQPGPDPLFRHQETGSLYGLPPNHINCRSWVNWEFFEGAQ